MALRAPSTNPVSPCCTSANFTIEFFRCDLEKWKKSFSWVLRWEMKEHFRLHQRISEEFFNENSYLSIWNLTCLSFLQPENFLKILRRPKMVKNIFQSPWQLWKQQQILDFNSFVSNIMNLFIICCFPVSTLKLNYWTVKYCKTKVYRL